MAARDRVYLQPANGFRFAGDGQAVAIASLFEGIEQAPAQAVLDALGIDTEMPITTTPTARGITGETWFANRIGGTEGVGTKEDPYNAGSYTNFDALATTAVAAGRMLMLHEGEFPTLGRMGFLLSHTYASGIVGNGMGRSIIKVHQDLQTYPEVWGYSALLHDQNFASNCLLLQGFTIDANTSAWADTPHRAVTCLQIGGNCNTIREVEAKGFYGSRDETPFGGASAPEIGEAWGIMSGGPEILAVNTSGALVENCIVTATAASGNYVNSYNMGSRADESHQHFGAVIRNCKAFMNGGRYPRHHVGFNIHNGILDACYTENCSMAVYSEGCWDLTIDNPDFRRCTWSGIHFLIGGGNTANAQKVRLNGGTIEMLTSGAFESQAAAIYLVEGGRTLRDVKVRGVTMTNHASSAYAPRHPVISSSFPNEIEFANNKIDAGFSLTPQLPSGTKFRFNHGLNYEPLIGYTDTPTYVPETIKGLTVWLEARFISGVADGAEMETWTNKTGSGLYHATGTTGPILRATGGPGGTPALEFTGTQNLTIAYTPVRPFTIFTIQFTDPANAGHSLSASVANDQLFGAYNTLPRTLYDGTFVGTGGDLSAWYCSCGVFVPGLATHYSLASLSLAAASTSGNAWGANMYIGSQQNIANYFTGKFAGLILFNRELSLAEIVAIFLDVKANYPGIK